jgi:dUTP pyrophosphatase
LVATSVSEDRKRNIITYGTGIAVEIPEGNVGYIFPRSSVYKHQVSLANCVGVIDSSYRGEIFLKFRIVQPHISRYTVGDKIGQLIIQPYPEIEFEEVDELNESDRGEGGFGSSGR